MLLSLCAFRITSLRRIEMVQNDCLLQCEKLVKLIEQEEVELKKSLQGELYDEYQKILQKDIRTLKDIQKIIKTGGN